VQIDDVDLGIRIGHRDTRPENKRDIAPRRGLIVAADLPIRRSSAD
jgi:hypothetical protein